ncbi:MAG: MotA/TolQ/ExbB proton channel family protein [Myxococcota bacterium]
MIEIIAKGGPVMYPIIAGSVLALAVFIERLWVLRQHRILPIDFFARVRELVESGRYSEALAACDENDSSLSQIITTILKSRDKSRSEIIEATEMTGKIEASLLNRFVPLLGVIATLEPLLGLLGTVTGLIAAFHKIETEGIIGDPRIVAGGVWEALLTTAAGLTVAIPTFVAYRYIKSRAERLVLQMEELSFRLIETISAKKGGVEEPADRQ